MTGNEQQQDERSTQHCQGGAGKLCSMLQNMNSSDSLLQNLGYEHHEHGTSVSLKFAINKMCTGTFSKDFFSQGAVIQVFLCLFH